MSEPYWLGCEVQSSVYVPKLAEGRSQRGDAGTGLAKACRGGQARARCARRWFCVPVPASPRQVLETRRSLRTVTAYGSNKIQTCLRGVGIYVGVQFEMPALRVHGWGKARGRAFHAGSPGPLCGPEKEWLPGGGAHGRRAAA